ncbi:TRAP transporter small permease [Oceanobacillus sp. CFH 90083]|uniref:TRAP transporter small permease n=1 Tax=Oceanobacillus sp. CFH 90083 TaxID=2592336 RepID=UPI001884633F|nr:TRAP transporter small permease [Oceanobacillus sp. CFH 90083]
MIEKMRIGWIKIEELLTSWLLLLLVGLVFMEVVVRAFGSPTTWSVGLAQLVFIWVIFLGANQALRNHAHVGVDAINYFLKPKLRIVVEMVMHVLMILFLIFLIYYGSDMVLSTTGRLITGTQIPYWTVTLAIPTGSMLMLLTALGQIFGKWRSVKGNNE